MKKQAGRSGSSIPPLTILSVSPHEEDHSSLEAAIRHCRWRLLKADGLQTASSLLQSHDVSIVLCECDLRPGTWTDILELVKRLPHSPLLIVTSKFADDRLWLEALNSGAWDVLGEPLQSSELLRTVRSAWQHRKAQASVPAPVAEMMTAAG